MAKKKTAKRASSRRKTMPAQPDATERHVERSPEVLQAADAVSKAKAELEKAQQLYRQVRQEAADRLKQAREMTVGDLIDHTLEAVKRHPGPGVVMAAAIGFFFGRLFGRLFRR